MRRTRGALRRALHAVQGAPHPAAGTQSSSSAAQQHHPSSPPPSWSGGRSHLQRLHLPAGVHTTCASWVDAAAEVEAGAQSARGTDVLVVEVVTGDVRGAGCTAPASLTLFGELGACPARLRVAPPGDNCRPEPSSPLAVRRRQHRAAPEPRERKHRYALAAVTLPPFYRKAPADVGTLAQALCRGQSPGSASHSTRRWAASAHFASACVTRTRRVMPAPPAGGSWKRCGALSCRSPPPACTHIRHLAQVRISRPSTGESFRFPCRRWLGHSDAGGAAFPLEHEVDVEGDGSGGPSSSSAAFPAAEPPLPPHTVPLTRPLTLRTGAAAVPHPDKMKAGARGIARQESGHAGEDAYFVVTPPGRVVLGVADGVYAWRDKGIDAGAFSRALCAAAASQAVAGDPEQGTVTSPLRLMQGAYRAVLAAQVQGSCTACFVVVDPAEGVVRSANVGDSGYLLMTPRRGQVAAAASLAMQATWQPGGVKYRSPHQEHEFGRPYQLGHHPNSDSPEDAMLHAARICGGDVLVVGSDGLWDNLHDSEVAAAVQTGIDAGHSPGAIARAVAAAAFERSTLKRGSTPYSLAASEAHDLVFSGGKRDDIAVLVMLAEA